ncbi:MAG: GNAT family N-acetyltransferase [Actinomycetaceae bacterium]|nr:GNAT family N-acetyltransferase [Actinomycetaceae bacterium]
MTVRSTNTVLRRLTLADLFSLIVAEEAIFPEDPWSQVLLTGELSRDDRLYIGAFVQDDLIGYAGARLGIDSDIMTVGVTENARGRGIGRMLVSELIARMRRIRIIDHHRFLDCDEVRDAQPSGQIDRAIRRIERAILEVRATNTPAIALYHSLGFTEIGRIGNYYRHPVEDAIVMEYRMANTSCES